jgi:MFS family permease
MVMAGVVAVLAFVPTLLLARDRPEEMGLAPDGDDVARPDGRRRPAPAPQPGEWRMRNAFRTPALWLIALMASANIFALSMITTHQVIHLEDIGIAPVAAASALGLMVGVSSIGRLAGGVAGQWLQLRYVAAAASAIQVVGLVMLTFATGLPMVYAYVLLFGFGYGAVVILFPSMVGAYFGRKVYSRLFGALFAIVSVLGAAAPAFAGYVFDASKSYLLPFSMAAGFCAVAAAGSLLNRPPILRAVASGKSGTQAHRLERVKL